MLTVTGVLERVREEGVNGPFTIDGLAHSLFGSHPDAPDAARAVIRGLIAARMN